MLIIKKVSELQAYLSQFGRGKKIGFAPTMGALHEGHLSLIEQANAECAVSVASIFVNPTQFNDPRDLEKYPRTPGRDIALLESVGCHVLFMPEVSEVYPPGVDIATSLNFKQLDNVMEGKFRPGHFAGMATVVNRLLEIVRPARLYMGQKDFQQTAIVAELLRQTNSKVKLIVCPTLREADGLAMSSRNVRLTPEMRAAAPVIFQTLLWAKTEFPTRPVLDIQRVAFEKLAAAGLRPEYFDLVDARTLLAVKQFSEKKKVVACVAAFAGEVRLIDNLPLTF